MSELTPVKSPVLPKELESAIPQMHGDMCVEVPKMGQYDLLWRTIIEFITDGCNLTGLFKEMLCESICATTTTTTTDCLFITTDTTTTLACYQETQQLVRPSTYPYTGAAINLVGTTFLAVPAGTYKLFYMGGAMTYDNGANFYLHKNDAFPFPKFYVYYNSGGNPIHKIEGPHTGYDPSGTVAGIEAASAGAFVQFTHDGGDIFIQLSDSSPDIESVYPTYYLAAPCALSTTTSTTTSGTTSTSTTTVDNGQSALFWPGRNSLQDSFIVPAGVTSIHAKVVGAGGDGGLYNQLTVGPYGGGGGCYAECDIAVTPGEILSIFCSSGSQNTTPNGLRTFIGRGAYNPPSSYVIAAGCGGFGGAAAGLGGTFSHFGAGTSNTSTIAGSPGTNPNGGAPGAVVAAGDATPGFFDKDAGTGGQAGNDINCFASSGAILISW